MPHLIDHAETPGAELCNHFVLADLLPWFDGHRQEGDSTAADGLPLSTLDGGLYRQPQRRDGGHLGGFEKPLAMLAPVE